ncbi:MAG: hypothetical protein EU547_05480 [Promethearchaeota archaeon]|nr:MAG: hypothetical protein EU547_05480 [Candidatus Lokiarchaeota archaeon]
MEDDKLKIELIFIGKPQWEAGWPYIGFNNEELIENITKHLNDTFSEIIFHPNELITTYRPDLIEKIRSNLKESDGIIIFTIGHYGDPGIVNAGIELIEFKNLPIILANIIYAGDHTFIKIYSSVKHKNYRLYATSSQDFQDFDKYIDIMCNLLRLRGEKIFLLATESKEINWDKVMELFNPERKKILKNYPEFVNQIGTMKNESFEFFTDLEGADQAHPWRVNADQYITNLADTFGVEIVRGNPNQINQYYDKVNKADAEKIAQKWIDEADDIEPTEDTLINSAKLYLALKNLLKDNNVRFFAPDCGTLLLLGQLPAYPCMAFLELSKESIYGICESDTNSTISFLLGLYITGRPGYVSNHTLDLEQKRVTYMHCVAPCNMYGKDKDFLNYDIMYHGESHFLGAAPRVKFPKGEILTTVKISVAKKKIAIRQGKILKNVKELGGCVAKIWVEDDVDTILQNYDWETFGWHRVSFLGDWKKYFEVAATLLGLELIEEDK